MVKILEQAIAELSNLPAADQEEIGRKLLTHVERIRLLRAELDKGVRSLEEGKGRELNVDEFLAGKRPRA